MADYRYLNADDVAALTQYFLSRLGYPPPILRGGGRALLESAVNRAHAAAYYAGADLAGQAAALTNGIALNHEKARLETVGCSRQRKGPPVGRLATHWEPKADDDAVVGTSILDACDWSWR